MADKTGIEWTDATWNPIVGCTIVSPGCTHCYAMSMAARIERMTPGTHYAGTTAPSKAGPVWAGKVALAPEHIQRQPLRWARPRRIFVNSMGDLFHEDVPLAWIDAVFAVMALCPQHTFQVLTKRSAEMLAYLTDDRVVRRIYTIANELRLAVAPDPDKRPTAFSSWMRASALDTAWLAEDGAAAQLFRRAEPGRAYPTWVRWPLPNVWLGVSAEDQARADQRVPDLLDAPAAVRFVSAEPLLGPLDLSRYLRPTCDRCAPWGVPCRIGCGNCTRLDWVIAGLESGPRARPGHPDWVRTIRDHCTAARAPFFFKQWGEWLPFGQSGFTHWSADTTRDGSLRGRSKGLWLGHAHFNDGAGGPETEVIGPVETLNVLTPGKASATQCVRIGKRRAGRLLDGVEHNDLPRAA